jgi:periplasmic protein TonB
VNFSATATHLPVPRPPSRSWQAFALALGIEAALLGMAIAWLITHPPQPVQKVVPITIESAVEPVMQKTVVPEPEKIKPPPPPPPPVARPLPIPVQAVKPIARMQAAPMPESASAPPSVPAPSPVPVQDAVAAPPAPPTAYTVPAAPIAPPPAPPPPPVAAVVDPSPGYNAKLAAAVQAVFVVPAAAADLGFKGRTRVEFSLRDGVVSAARVILTSGLGAADRAAIKAVQAATYPAPPPALLGKENSYQIWVACL